jgi:hypothetical protein
MQQRIPGLQIPSAQDSPAQSNRRVDSRAVFFCSIRFPVSLRHLGRFRGIRALPG